MRITLTSLFVDDQEKALNFYTEILGFVKKADIPLGEYRWLTVGSADDNSDMELHLEPNENDAAKAYQEAIYKERIPATSFSSDDIYNEYEKLKALNVKFNIEPTDMGEVIVAVFDDTCGNLIQLHQA